MGTKCRALPTKLPRSQIDEAQRNRWLPGPPAFEHREEAEHDGRLLERGSRVGAVAGRAGGGAEARWLPGEDQEGELERLGDEAIEFFLE